MFPVFVGVMQAIPPVRATALAASLHEKARL
jgi:hypothetical protein